MTPLQFVTRERMLQAQQLIRETSRSLIEIALEVGYTIPIERSPGPRDAENGRRYVGEGDRTIIFVALSHLTNRRSKKFLSIRQMTYARGH